MEAVAKSVVRVSGSPELPRGIKYVSFEGPGGYAVAAKRYFLALAQSGIPVTWTPMVENARGRLGYKPSKTMQYQDSELAPYCSLEIDYDTVIVHTTPEYFPMWIERERGKRIIGCTVWETDLLPRHWKKLLNSVDALTVPCKWNRKVFFEDGITVPIHVVPHIALEPCNDVAAWPGVSSEDFVFYSINVWTNRKCMWSTIEAYLNAFCVDDPVCLIIKTSKLDYSIAAPWWARHLGYRNTTLSKAHFEEILARYPKPAKIVFLDEVLSDLDMRQLHQRADCYLSLCRSEGWGMGAFDACAYGNEVIMTGYGGQLDYLPPHLAHLVDFRLIAVKDPYPWSQADSRGLWAEPDVKHASTIMRKVFEDRALGPKRARQLQQFVCSTFSSEKVLESFMQAVRRPPPPGIS